MWCKRSDAKGFAPIGIKNEGKSGDMKPNLLFFEDEDESAGRSGTATRSGRTDGYPAAEKNAGSYRHMGGGRNFGIARPAGLDRQASTYEDSLVPDTIADLNLSVVFDAMARQDPFLRETARQVVPASVTDPAVILYRQEILKDGIRHPAAIQKLYRLSSEAVEDALFYRNMNQPNYAQMVPMAEKVQKALGLLVLLIDKARLLKQTVTAYGESFHSKGLRSFCDRIGTLLSDAFLMKADAHVSELRSLAGKGRLVIGSGLGQGLKGTGHVLRKISNPSASWKTGGGLFGRKEVGTIYLDDINLSRSASEMEEAGFVHVLRVISRFSDDLFRFFAALRFETGFYEACINLHKVFAKMGLKVCFPVPMAEEEPILAFDELADAGMALSERALPVANRLSAEGMNLFIITGANQGGKSTYLRSIGLAQIFMQCGLFVTAAQYRASIRDSVYTHFPREEDAGMDHGRLDEELARMDAIVRKITSRSMLLLNESFATTTEREGAQIATDIVLGLHEQEVAVLYVTHLYEFALGMQDRKPEKTMFLRAERAQDGFRSFRIEPGEPLSTSYGEDLYAKIMTAT
jgi:hypothetical protein